MIKLFDSKTEKNKNIKIFSLTKKYTKEKTVSSFSFYNWREMTKIKVKTDEILNEFGRI